MHIIRSLQVSRRGLWYRIVCWSHFHSILIIEVSHHLHLASIFRVGDFRLLFSYQTSHVNMMRQKVAKTSTRIVAFRIISSRSEDIFRRYQLAKTCTAFYKTRDPIAVFTKTQHTTYTYLEPHESSPRPPILFLLVLILFSNLHLGFPSRLLPSGFSSKTVCQLSARRATISTILLVLNLIIWPIQVFGVEY